MASARIGVISDGAHVLGGRIRDVANKGADFRKSLGELQLIVTKYAADPTAITNDTGIVAGEQTTFINLMTQAANEMNGLASTQVSVGAATGVRQLLDALSTGG